MYRNAGSDTSKRELKAKRPRQSGDWSSYRRRVAEVNEFIVCALDKRRGEIKNAGIKRKLTEQGVREK